MLLQERIDHQNRQSRYDNNAVLDQLGSLLLFNDAVHIAQAGSLILKQNISQCQLQRIQPLIP